MAPPRQRPLPNSIPAAPAGGDDSRSEASSTATGGPTSRGVPGPKPRKSAANAAGAGSGAALASAKELKVAAAANAAAAASGLVQQNGVDMYGIDGLRDDLPGIPWHQMPLSILHDYRHAYKLSTPSAYARPISKIYFSSGIGLRSPTAIAARKAAQAVATSSSSSSSSNSSTSSGPTHRSRTTAAGVLKPTTETNRVHKINSQDRVGKEQLALAVRKHFNAAGLVEQDAIARFLYKVREEGKGREFRLRFQP